MEEYLKSLAVNLLKPSDEEIKAGKSVMDEVFRYFQTSKLYSIDRPRLVGGTEKKTSIRGFVDIDCVVFVNPTNKKGQPVYIPEVLHNFQQILSSEIDMKDQDMKVSPDDSPTTLKFSYKNVDFDISVCLNNVNPSRSQEITQTSREQYKGYKACPGSESQSTYQRSVALIEYHIEFAASKSAFAHEIARLAKFWNKTIHPQLALILAHVKGRSSIMELVAFKAAEEEEKCHCKSYLNAFKRFLRKMNDFKSLAISHEDYWKEVGIKKNETNLQLPYILEPTDPSDNFLKTMKPQTMDFFANCAAETLRHLEKGLAPGGLFKMQPLWHGKSILAWPPKLLVDTRKTPVGFKPINYNNSSKKGNEAFQNKIKCLNDYLTPLVRREVSNALSFGELYSVEKVKEKIERSINSDILNVNSAWRRIRWDKHEDHDATLMIPFYDGSKYCILISVNE